MNNKIKTIETEKKKIYISDLCMYIVMQICSFTIFIDLYIFISYRIIIIYAFEMSSNSL